MSGLYLILSLAYPTTSLSADNVVEGFKTPSGNIACYFDSDAKTLVCEVAKTKWSPSPKPDDCENLDSGKQVSMTTNSAPTGGWWCRGDTWLHGGIVALAYGTQWQKNGFTCLAQKKHLTCRNTAGYGWNISKSSVTFFNSKK